MNKITGNELIDKCLTIRQYFAAMAMQGILGKVDLEVTSVRHVAERAVDAAYALINELNKSTPYL